MIRSLGEGGISLWNLILYVILSLAVITGIVR